MNSIQLDCALISGEQSTKVQLLTFGAGNGADMPSITFGNADVLVPNEQATLSIGAKTIDLSPEKTVLVLADLPYAKIKESSGQYLLTLSFKRG